MNTVYNNLEVVHSTARLDRIRWYNSLLALSSIGLIILDTGERGELGADESKFDGPRIDWRNIDAITRFIYV